MLAPAKLHRSTLCPQAREASLAEPRISIETPLKTGSLSSFLPRYGPDVEMPFWDVSPMAAINSFLLFSCLSGASCSYSGSPAQSVAASKKTKSGPVLWHL
jgi:hypothetical protein